MTDRPRLLTYRHVWTKRDRYGDMQYEYLCTYSDGSRDWQFSLSWGTQELAEAVELPMTSLKKLEEERRLAA